MNSLQRQRLMNNLPKDSALENIFHDTTLNSEKALYKKIKSWVNWRKFYLVITVLFYAIYYYRKHKDQETRNIFKAISQTSTQLKVLKKIINDKDLKEKEALDENNDNHVKNENDSSVSYESPLAMSKALKSKRPKAIKFENNILKCYRLQDGNFLVQHPNYDIHIVDSYGKKINSLNPIESDTKFIIDVITELSDGTIILAGKNPDSIHAKIQTYNNYKISNEYELSLDQVKHIDHYGKTIVLLGNTAGKYYAQILEINEHNIQFLKSFGIIENYIPQEIILLTHDLVVINFKSTETHSNKPTLTQQFNLNTNTINTLEFSSTNLTRDFQNQLIFTNNTSKAHLRIHDSSQKVLVESDILEHQGAISKIAISPNGKFLVTADWDGQVILWNYEILDIIKTYDTEIFYIVNLFVNNHGEICVAEGELENFSTTAACDGQATIPNIHFYNRASKTFKINDQAEEKSQNELSVNPGMSA